MTATRKQNISKCKKNSKTVLNEETHHCQITPNSQQTWQP